MKKKTDLPRRRFLEMAMVAGMTPAVAKASAVTSMVSGSDQPGGWFDLEYEQFSQMIGQRFEIQREDESPMTIELVKVESNQMKNRPAWLPRKHPFTAKFRPVIGQHDADLSNATIKHRKLGSSKLLLTHRKGDSGVVFEGVFS